MLITSLVNKSGSIGPGPALAASLSVGLASLGILAVGAKGFKKLSET